MFSQALLLSVFAVINCQFYEGDPSLAKILTDRRKQTIGGDFGVSFEQEDGTNFHEVADVDGYRVGQYSYIDSFGVKKTVKYEAGPEIGFRIISADNIPRPVQLPAQHQQITRDRAQQRFQQAQQTRNQAPQPQPQPQPQNFGPPQPFSFTLETGVQSQTRPQQVRKTQPQQFRRRQQQQVRRPQPSPSTFPQPSPSAFPQSTFAQPIPSTFPQPSPSAFPQTTFETDAVPTFFTPTTTTRAPRFFPPGQISLTRNEKGYVYSFSS